MSKKREAVQGGTGTAKEEVSYSFGKNETAPIPYF